jgi:hypothetical protein
MSFEFTPYRGTGPLFGNSQIHYVNIENSKENENEILFEDPEGESAHEYHTLDGAKNDNYCERMSLTCCTYWNSIVDSQCWSMLSKYCKKIHGIYTAYFGE